jgi:hypothetical protein
MFTHETILALRPLTLGAPQPQPEFGHFRNEYFARTLMETKQFLLRCLRRMHTGNAQTPDVILIDAGQRNGELREELARWMEAHPQLDGVRIKFPARPGWLLRRWKRFIRREGTTAAST